MANTIKIDVLADVRDINKGIKDVNGKLGDFQGKLGKVGSALKTAFVAGAATIAGAGIVSGITSTISAASDLNETVSKTQQVFGNAAPDILKFGDNASRAFGVSKQEALSGLSAFGNLFDQIGIGTQESAKMSKGFLQMSADLGSFNNADPGAVMDSLIAATRGEYDALQAFVPTVNAASVETEALALSHKKAAKDLTAADKATALYSLTAKGMGKAQGDFARTSGGLANQQRILSARFKDAQAELGQKLLPIALKVVTFFNTGFGPATAKIGAVFSQMGSIISTQVIPPIAAIVGFVQQNATAFLAAAAAIAAVTVAIGIYKGVLATASAITKAYTAVQAALNVVMLLNPIGLVILALVALAAIFIVAYKRSDTFRKVVDGAFKAVKTGVIAVINFFKNLPGNISKAVGNLGSLLKRKGSDLINGLASGYNSTIGAVAGFFRSLPGKILGWIGALGRLLVRKGAELINGLANGYNNAIGAVANFFRGIAGRVLSAIGNLGSTLFSAGTDIIQGLLNGITSRAGAVIGKAREIANSIKNTIGSALKFGSPSKVMIQFGKWIGDGLAIGMKNVAGVKSAATGLAGAVADGFSAPELSISGDGAGTGGDVHIHLDGTFIGSSKREIGKWLEEALAEYQKFGRSRVVMTR